MISLRDLSIKKKLIAIQLLITFIILLFYCVFLVFNELRVFRNSVVSQLTSMAQLISTNSTSALRFLDNETAEEVLSSLKTEENIVNAWIYDVEGNIFAKYSKIGYTNFSFPKVEKESHEFKEDYITLSKKIIADDDVIGMVSLRLSMEQYWNVVGQNIIIASSVLIIGMIIAFLLSILTQKAITNPILHLVEITKKVSETGDYSIRVEREDSDEISTLYNSFNNMMEQIHIREMERDRVGKSLRESEEKYKTLLENLPQKIFLKDRNSVYISCNDNYSRDLRIKPDEITGKTDYKFYPKELAEKYRADDKRIMKSGKTEHIEEEYIQDEQRVIVHTVKTPVKSEDGNVIGILSIFWDITEQKKMEQMLIQSEKMASIGTLAAGIAHEINNPIGYINSNLKIIEEYNKKLMKFCSGIKSLIDEHKKSKSDEVKIFIDKFNKSKKDTKVDYLLTDTKNALEESIEGTEKVKKIVLDLRDFSRVEKPEIKPANINDGIEKTLNVIWNELKYKAELIKEFSDIPKIECDIQRLGQVFMNILVNAVQAIEENGIITIKTFSVNDSVVIQISDTGKGIPKEDIVKIFDAFYTTKELGKGTGLGLSISYRIIEEHNGTINVESEVGKGTTFTIKLPVKFSMRKII